MVSIVFCRKCGSTNVDVVCWEKEDIARFRCSHCGHEATINGFTLGRVDLHRATVLEAAQDAELERLKPFLQGEWKESEDES